jgi:hypothetical protein
MDGVLPAGAGAGAGLLDPPKKLKPPAGLGAAGGEAWLVVVSVRVYLELDGA